MKNGQTKRQKQQRTHEHRCVFQILCTGNSRREFCINIITILHYYFQGFVLSRPCLSVSSLSATKKTTHHQLIVIIPQKTDRRDANEGRRDRQRQTKGRGQTMQTIVTHLHSLRVSALWVCSQGTRGQCFAWYFCRTFRLHSEKGHNRKTTHNRQ